MPTNVVKTLEQEKLWDKAKARAAAEGQAKNYAYIMGIFKKMGGLEKKASTKSEIKEKEQEAKDRIQRSFNKLYINNETGKGMMGGSAIGAGTYALEKLITKGKLKLPDASASAGLGGILGGTFNNVSARKRIYDAEKIRKKASDEIDELFEKTAKPAGYFSKLIGRNVGKVQKEIDTTRDVINRTKDLGKATRTETVQRGFGPFKSTKTKEVPQYSAEEIHSRLKGDINKLKDLKRQKRIESRKTFGTRVKTLAGAGVAGGAAYAVNQGMSGNKPKSYQYQPISQYAEETQELIQKIAYELTKEAKMMAQVKDIYNTVKTLGVKAGKDVKNVATLKNYRDAASNVKAVRSGKVNTGNSDIDRLVGLKQNIDKLTKRNQKINRVVDKYSGGATEKNVDRVLQNAINTKVKFDDRSAQNIKRKVDTLRNLGMKNEKTLGVAQDTYAKGEQKFVNKRDNELAKAIGLYGTGAGLAGYGIHKAIKKKKQEE